ncbi:MAG: dihydroorotate dehydrogenase electron transfer subunit [Candidatus Omnitrophica bacterium]|nr:dihydroorotate dehydrogenase electron transfer subunit [Candidatus Omnitrophota bacterium]MCF7891937.1 dihydroorotate dehydrogenase electron transfer subunit [Candidatus Omnitrophota bacterium]MCF7897444.1 dihydroorotate dehydrogenase electron transfer subunit [Candidatus Omnitrophota bacterium]MCF7909378.1 dihydroorotate dehydrogenase electron transfer subunit [Candidatus Omnitrophota bacterium]
MQAKVKQFNVKLREVKKVKDDIFLLSFQSSHIARVAQPGNFLHLKLQSTILRRPLSIHKIENNLIYILFKVRGRGTKALAQKRKNDRLDIIGPLGNGFKIKKGENSILVGGGIGVAPLLFLAQKLVECSTFNVQRSTLENIILLGAKDRKEVVCEKEFKNLGFRIKVATEDGSKGQKGFVTDLLKKQLMAYDLELRTHVYACGPKGMFYQISKIVKQYKDLDTQLSFEQFMGCGLGVCCACVILTKAGYKKVCQDGPVFSLKEIY